MKRVFVIAMVLATGTWAAVFWNSRGDAPTPPSPAFILGFSLFLGLCCAVLTTLVALVARGLTLARPTVALDQPGERLVATVAANHWQGIEARGGRLHLTTHALRFVPHRFNFSLDRVDLPLSHITEMGGSAGLVVATPAGLHRFVAPDPSSLIAGITAQSIASGEPPMPPPPWVPVTPP